MDLPIKNVNDLRSEIFRLKQLEHEKSIELGVRFKNPSAAFSSLMTLFPKTANPDGTKSGGFFSQDIMGLASRFLLPLTLNKTIFRHSNVIIKTLVGLVSQKASHFITEDSVSGIWGKITSLFKHKESAAKPVVPVISAETAIL